MTTAPELETVTLITEDGSAFDLWTDMTLSDDFLSPCQTITLSVATDDVRFDLTKKIIAGAKFSVKVGEATQISGFIDSVEVSGDAHGSGTVLSVTGRDILSPVVDGNIDVRYQPTKDTTLQDLAAEVFQKQYGLEYTIFDSYHEAVAKAVGSGFTRKKGAGSTKRRKITDPVKEAKPHDNEGAFEYFRRVAHRHGFHAWACPDGQGVVLASPNYDQLPVTDIVAPIDGNHGAQNQPERFRAKFDVSGIPSVVHVRGKSTQPGPKIEFAGSTINYLARRYVPFFTVDDKSSTKEHCDRVARFMLGRAMRNYLAVYTTHRGLACRTTGRVWNVDTVVNTKIERAGIEGRLWIESRTFRKSRGGTFTDLKLIPLDTFLFDVPPDEDPPNPTTAAADSKKKTRIPRDPSAFEEENAASWFGGGRQTPGKY